MTATGGTILWRRLDRAGHEAARLDFDGDLWRLEGSAVFEHDGRACRLDYRIDCDPSWRTRAASVAGWLGDERIRCEIEHDGEGNWTLDGLACPQVAGATDVDLNFSPSTNLLPIRRLSLAVGDESEVLAAWLRFPTFVLEPLPQLYRRTAPTTYHYESAGGRFVADLEVDESGFVLHYPGLCRAESRG
jgi:hypothetical protein